MEKFYFHEFDFNLILNKFFLFKIIKNPLIINNLKYNKKNILILLVSLNSTKMLIKNCIEFILGFKVIKINTIIYKNYIYKNKKLVKEKKLKRALIKYKF